MYFILFSLRKREPAQTGRGPRRGLEKAEQEGYDRRRDDQDEQGFSHYRSLLKVGFFVEPGREPDGNGENDRSQADGRGQK